MIYLIFPMGSYHGWGICGKYITKGLSEFTDVKLITEDLLSKKDKMDILDYNFLLSKYVGEQEIKEFESGRKNFDAPVLQAISGINMQPYQINQKNTYKVGYTFFENNIFKKEYVKNAKVNYDLVIAGSKWNENIMRSSGLTNVKTIIQGIDKQIFNPYNNQKKYFKDKFVIFSGGKFELRKGQDLVIRAYKVLQDKYKDVMLITSWYNSWQWSISSMQASPYIKIPTLTKNYLENINKTLILNGIDITRVINLPLTNNVIMPRIYKNTDIGIFPNRCEGGTNLVLMEYMACGKPVIASYNTGHKDILTDRNSIKLEYMRTGKVKYGGEDVGGWEEASLDELIAKLDFAYNNRDKLAETGKTAGKDLSKLTWEKTASEFYKLFKNQY